MRSRLEIVRRAIEQLANPFEEMSLDQKKELTLFLFYTRLQVQNWKNYEFVVAECFGF